MLYRDGRITGSRLDQIIRAGDDEEKVTAWIDSLVADLQNWDGGTI